MRQLLPALLPRRGCLTPRAIVAAGLVGLAGLTACSGPPPAIAYSAPAPGTVYDYGDFTNTITAVDGWRTTYVDDRGRTARRVALFITENPQRPLDVDSVALGSLWPLRLGAATTVRTRAGEEVYRWKFRVVDTTTVTVPAGTFAATVVEGIEVPELVHAPQQASSVLNTWWYAPAARAVVRFESTYLTGPVQGRRVIGELKAIRTPPRTDSGQAPAAPR
jgi:hypothetical protein